MTELPPSTNSSLDLEYEFTNEKISLIIPIYNEAGHLESFLEMADSLLLPAPKQLVIVNDCSTDTSAEIIGNFLFRSEFEFIDLPENRGKGNAIRTGIEHATGTIIGVQDADFEYSMSDIPKLIRPILENSADVCYGSRYKSSHQVHRTYHYLVNRLLTMMSNLLSGMYLTDMETCYKFFRADVLKNIITTSNRFGFEPEITAKIARLKLRVVEFPISYFPRNYFEGKKITWKDGIAAFWHILYFNCFCRPRAFFRNTLPSSYIPGSSQWF